LEFGELILLNARVIQSAVQLGNVILYGSETLFQAKNLIRIGQRTLGNLILVTGDKEEAEEWQGK
jgi:hypothetical protein